MVRFPQLFLAIFLPPLSGELLRVDVYHLSDHLSVGLFGDVNVLGTIGLAPPLVIPHLCHQLQVCFRFILFFSLLKLGNQIHVEVFIAGGGSFLLLAEDADHVVVQSQAVGHSEVTHSSLVVLRHVNRLARVLT